MRETRAGFKLSFRKEEMQDIEAELAAALRDRLALIADEASRQHPQAHLARLEDASNRITELQARLPTPVHPQLAHFLARCSYSKALDFLEEK